MLLQNWHTVCTLLDQRKTILAPQFGQLAIGWGIGNDPPGRRHEDPPQSLATRFHWDWQGLSSRRTATECAQKSCRRTVSKSPPPRATHPTRVTQTDPCTGNRG